MFIGVSVLVGVCVFVGVSVLVGVGVLVGVCVFIGVSVLVGVCVFVGVSVLVGVCVFGGISWNLGGIDYIEFLPKYKDKGYLKYLVYDNMDKNGEVKFVTASDELTKKLSNYGNIDYDQNTDITSVTLNKDYLKESSIIVTGKQIGRAHV